MISKKINIGSGSSWYSEGWETLDNGPGDYSKGWKHRGKCWDTKLKSYSYNVVFTSHMLEHVPHFRLEKTISEFNRILKKNGILRIVVPDLKKMVNAYVKKDVNFYRMSRHYTNHLGIGGSFLSKLISPGKNTMAVSREMDEIFGGYAHIYHFDYEMLEILLKKWGFKEIYKAKYCQSNDIDMQTPQCLIHNKKKYLLQSNFVRKKEFLKLDNWYHSGFDRSPETSLFVECKKERNESYSYNKEFSYNKRNRFDSREDKIKLFFIKIVISSFDKIFFVLRKIKNFLNKFF